MLLRICLFLSMLFCLTSCFEVVEDVTFKKDGSGVFKLIINLSQSKNELNTLMKLDSSSGYKIPKEKQLNAYFDQALRTLKTTEGLSNSIVKRDFKNWVFEIKTDFRNTTDLENGIKNVYGDFSGNKAFIFLNTLAFNGKTFAREIGKPDEKTLSQLNKPTEKRILGKAKYIAIYRFETNIMAQRNSKAKISPSKKAVMLQCNILNIINGKETIQNHITLN